jgi:hypothetical protein
LAVVAELENVLSAQTPSVMKASRPANQTKREPSHKIFAPIRKDEDVFHNI